MLRRHFITDYQLMQTNWEKILGDSQLISLPEVYIKLQQLIDSDDYSLAEIVETISFEPAITARLLRMVNSSFFGLSSPVETITHAINYLGAKQVHDLVLATSMADTFSDMNTPAFNMHQFWKQSIYCAIFAQDLAALCDEKQSERLFITGLLHNTGYLMMRQSIPDLILQAEALSEQQQIPMHIAEEQLIGFNYAQIGAELLHRWNLPVNLTSAIKHQLVPSQAEEFQIDAAILHIAANMAALFAKELPTENAIAQLDKYAIDFSNIENEQLVELDLAVKESLGSVIQLLFPQY